MFLGSIGLASAPEDTALPLPVSENANAGELETVRVLYGWSAAGVEEDAQGVRVEAVHGRNGERITVQALLCCWLRRQQVRHTRTAGIRQTRSDHDRLMVLLVLRSEQLHRLLERHPGKSDLLLIFSSTWS